MNGVGEVQFTQTVVWHDAEQTLTTRKFIETENGPSINRICLHVVHACVHYLYLCLCVQVWTVDVHKLRGLAVVVRHNQQPIAALNSIIRQKSIYQSYSIYAHFETPPTAGINFVRTQRTSMHTAHT